MRRLSFLLVVVAAAGCKKSREDTCDELAKLGIAVADELGKQLSDGKSKSLGADPEVKAKMAELKAQCMTWPEEVFECMRANDETSPKCVEAMSKVTGTVSTDVGAAPAGPPIVASATLGEPGWDGLPVVLAADGTLTAAPKEAIVAVAATGTQRWRAPIEHDGWLLALPDGAILTGDREAHALVALDRTTGEVMWRAAIPPSADEYADRTTEGAVRAGGRTFVAIADGRFLRVDPAACAKPAQKGCLELAFALPDETFDKPDLLALGDDIVLGESNAIRRITTKGKVVAWVHVRDSLGGIAVAGGSRLAAVIDDELVLLDLARCPGAAAVLPRKRGRMYIRGEGDCDHCVAPPDGCVVARSELSDLDAQAPMVLRDGSIAASNWDGPARVAPNGNKHWLTEVDAVGPMREVGDAIVFVSRGDDDQPPRVVALATATGKATWTRPLVGIKSSEISSTTDTIVETAGPWLVAGAKGSVSWMKAR